MCKRPSFFVLFALVAGCAAAGTGHPFPDGGVGGNHDMSKPVNCQFPLSNCNGMCVNLSSNFQHCGECQTACMNGQTCQAGKCTGGMMMCNGGLTLCNGQCVDTANDPSNCGGCGNVCQNAGTCQGGQCQGGMMMCMGGLTLCNGQCVDTNTDAANCGACGNVCQNGGTCQGGLCMGGMMMCNNGLTMCNGKCVDTNTDVANCGGCAKMCAMNQTCQGGACVGMMNNKTGCNGFIACANACNDNPCVQACYANTTAQGQQLVQNLLDCLEFFCPSTPGDICDPNGGNPQLCSFCYQTAQMQNGWCYQDLVACQNNKP